MRKLFFLLVFVIAAGISVTMVMRAHVPVPNADPNHTHADFAVWVNGAQLDFSAPELMSGSSTDANHDNEEGLRKFLHLHDGIGFVVHRHKPGLTLKDFFDTLQVGFTDTCYASFAPLADGQECGETLFRMFVNGIEQKPFDLAYDFADGDKILITNAAADEDVQKQLKSMTDDACKYSKTCPWKGKPPAENCIADPTVPCVVH